MKRIILFLLLLILLSSMTGRCYREISDIGNDSIYFKVNGKPIVPHLYTGNFEILKVFNQNLLLYIPANDKYVALEIYIPDFQGEGRYTIDGNNALAIYHTNYSRYLYFADSLGNLGFNDFLNNLHLYDSIVSPSYLHVLDYDPVLNEFQGVFEFHVADSLGAEAHITKGRIFLGYY